MRRYEGFTAQAGSLLLAIARSLVALAGLAARLVGGLLLVAGWLGLVAIMVWLILHCGTHFSCIAGPAFWRGGRAMRFASGDRPGFMSGQAGATPVLASLPVRGRRPENIWRRRGGDKRRKRGAKMKFY